ncbi:MAG: helix-turn-helix domain-containing protein [Lachnospiraceae bacterium]|nr:helix-turn-helix domain-containing protein [Lachnospiraceae bacterium]
MKLKEKGAQKENGSYISIDMEKTGVHLKNLIAQEGYTVKDIQRHLHLSCPQPVYRWFKGKILPSVDHLYTLSRLLHVHMEELLLPAGDLFLNTPLNRISGETGGRQCYCGNITNYSDIFISNSLILNIAAGRECRQLAAYWKTMRKQTA